jgi:hypothetical protein
LESNDQYKDYIQHLIDYGWNGEDVRRVINDIKNNAFATYKENFESFENERKDKEQVIQREEKSKKRGGGFNNSYTEAKQKAFRERYNRLRDKIAEEQKDPDLTIDYNEKNKEVKEQQTRIREDVFSAINKIYAAEWKEEDEIRKAIWRDKKDILREIKESFREAGLDYKDYVKEYRNIDEMLDDFDKTNKDFFGATNSENKKLGDSIQALISDYYLSLKEYNKLTNFRKVYLKEKIDDLLKTFQETSQILDKQQIDLERKDDKIEYMKKEAKNYLDLVQDYMNIEHQLNLNPDEFLSIEKIMTQNLRDKLQNIKKTNLTPAQQQSLIKRMIKRDIKQPVQQGIDNILKRTNHISQRSTKEYAKVIYEDTPFFKDIKRINRMGETKASEELLSFRKEREKNKTNLTLKQQELKEQLLYFKSSPEVSLDNAKKILENLITYAEDSIEQKNNLDLENKLKILEKKQEVIDTLKDVAKNKKPTMIGRLMVNHFSNYKVLLKYLGGKKLADEYNFADEEIGYDVGVKNKMDKIFNELKEKYNAKQVKEMFADLNKEVLTVKVSEPKNQPRQVRLTTDWESFWNELRRDLEYKENLDGTPNNNRGLIDIINSFQPVRKRGQKNYEYKFTDGEIQILINALEEANNSKIQSKVKDIEKIQYDVISEKKLNGWSIMLYDLWSRNTQTKILMDRYYIKDIAKIKSLALNQSPIAKDFANILFANVQDREELNPYFVMVYGQDMGLQENYFPRKSFHEEVNNIFSLEMTSEERKKTISAIEQRSLNAIPDLTANPFSLAFHHIQQTEYVKNIAPKLKNTLQIFSGRTKETMDELFGKEMYKGLENDLKDFNYNRKVKDPTELEKLMNFFLVNWARSVTNTPSVFLKQTSSFLPYSEGLNLGD